MAGGLLILSASVGAGHLRAAAAVEQAAKRLHPELDVRNVDILAHTNPLYRRLAARTYVNLVRDHPKLMAYMYDRLDRPFANERTRAVLNGMNFRSLVRLIDEFRPRAVISTHFIAAEIVGTLKRRGRLAAPLGVCVTDLDVHAIWLCRGADRYFVALAESREYLTHLGVSLANVHLTGIPIDGAFNGCRQTDSSQDLGLDPLRPVVLIASGGVGMGPTETIVDHVLRMKLPAQAVVICGHNESLKRRLDAKRASLPDDMKARLHVCGFTTRMHDYMAAATLLVGKPGGLSLSEAMASTLPMVIVNPLPGQEERNTTHLLEQGAAVRCNNLPTLGWKIERLLEDPERLKTMRAAAQRLAKPHAAESVVRIMMGELQG